MFSRKLAAFAAFSLMTASTVAQAQSVASPGPAAAVERTGAATSGASELEGSGLWIVGAIVAGLVIWGIIELVDDDDDPASP